MALHFLGSNSYVGPLRDAALEKGRSACTHLGLVRLPGQPHPVQAVIKVYPPGANGETRELLNEFVGDFLARRLGFAVPEHAGTLVLRRRRWHKLALWRNLPTGTRQVTAWWSQRSALKSVKARYRLGVMKNRSALHDPQIKALAKELLAAAQCPGIIAFDHLAANIDRNLGNLLGPEDARYLLIDHGCCLTGPQWTIDDLVAERRYPNKLYALLSHHGMPLPFANAAVATFDRIQPHISATMSALSTELTGVATEAEIKAIIAFLTARADRQHAAKRLGLIA